MEVSSTSLGKNSMKRDHLSIEIMNEDVLLSSIKGKMESISLPHQICRVPQELSSGNEDKYFPTLVSIGPFHHGEDSLKSMEAQKWRYFNTLLGRNPNTETVLESAIRAVRHLEQKSRNFYGESIDHMGSDQFVEMMLVDGCFIIELFLEYSLRSLRRKDDPFFSVTDRILQLRCDLILLENQLPFFILDQLFHIVQITKYCQMSLIQLALCFFRKFIPGDHKDFSLQILPPASPETHHLLDLIRLHYLPTDPEVLPLGGGEIQLNHATQLSAAGIRVKRAAVSETPSDIRFFNGELKIPSLEIHIYTEILFRNLLAMEKYCRPECSKHVTSYVVLMEELIRLKSDVRLLQDKGILIDGHYGEGGILHLFKRLRLNLDKNVKDFYYRGLCEQVNEYQTKRKQVGWRNIRHIYYRTRLGIAGFSLAVLFLVLLFTGALLSALTFLLHHFQ